MNKHLTDYEQETIINFNKEEKVAYIFTYEKSWQRFLENKLGLKPVKDNGFGGKEYILEKYLIRLPAKKQIRTERQLEAAMKGAFKPVHSLPAA